MLKEILISGVIKIFITFPLHKHFLGFIYYYAVFIIIYIFQDSILSTAFLCYSVSVNKEFLQSYFLHTYFPQGPYNFFIPQAVDKWVQKRCNNGIKYSYDLVLFRGMQGVWPCIGGESGYIEQTCHSQVRGTSGDSFCLPFSWTHLEYHSKYTGIGS